jgi:hypothetical protein
VLGGRRRFIVEVKSDGRSTTPCTFTIPLESRNRGVGVALISLAIEYVQSRDMFFLRVFALAVENRDRLEGARREWGSHDEVILLFARVGAEVKWRCAGGCCIGHHIFEVVVVGGREVEA